MEYILEVARYREVGSQSWVSEKGYWGGKRHILLNVDGER